VRDFCCHSERERERERRSQTEAKESCIDISIESKLMWKKQKKEGRVGSGGITFHSKACSGEIEITMTSFKL